MTEMPSPHPEVERARELFFDEGRIPDAGVSERILRSWRRSEPIARREVELIPVGRDLLAHRRDQARLLMSGAQPELDALTEHVAAHGCVLVVSDAGGLILEELGSPDFLPRAQQLALRPGMEWSEGSLGTNAIGTALAEGVALTVRGREHYLDQIGSISCAASPVVSSRGALLGVIDISGDARGVDLHALGLVRMAAGQIEHRLTLAAARGDVLRFHRRPSLIGTPREALIVVEAGRVVAANRSALEHLGRDWQSMLDREVEEVLGTRWRVLGRQRGLLTLPDGTQIAALSEPAGEPGARRSTVALRAAAPAPAQRTPMHAAAGGPNSDPLLDLPDGDATSVSLARALRVLDEGVPVLITGETGTGKEVFARRLHARSRRAGGPLVAVNCASIPESLIEAELFGYEEGAYTGARRKGMPGRIREADGGVLFLDEIADMPLALQTRLLRVLEDRQVQPLGGGRSQAVDFDLICATHGDLQARAADGRFRADLMYRIAGFQVSLPALRERADLPALVESLFERLGAADKRLSIGASAWSALLAHDWPGNVRELRNALRVLVALADDGQMLEADDLPTGMTRIVSPTRIPAPAETLDRASASSRPLPPVGGATEPMFHVTPAAAEGEGRDKACAEGSTEGFAENSVEASAENSLEASAENSLEASVDASGRIVASSPTGPVASGTVGNWQGAGSLDQATRLLIDAALARHGGQVVPAAQDLGMHRSTLYRHLARRRRARQGPPAEPGRPKPASGA